MRTASIIISLGIGCWLWSPPLARSQPTVQVIHAMGGANGLGVGAQQLAKGKDGRLYGVTYTGAVPGTGGTLYRTDTNGANPEVLLRFQDVGDSVTSQVRIVSGSDGFVYLWCHTVGSSGDGRLLKVNPETGAFQTLVTGATAKTGVWEHLMEGSDHRLYATTGGKMVRIERDGTGFVVLTLPRVVTAPQFLIETDPGRFGYIEDTLALVTSRSDGLERRVLMDFSTLFGIPLSALTAGSDGRVYGALMGLQNNDGSITGPKVFRINPDGSERVDLRELPTFPEAGLIHGSVIGSLMEASDGLLYGSVNTSGRTKAGYVFRMARDGSNFAKILDYPDRLLAFDSERGFNLSPMVVLQEGGDGRLHGARETSSPEGDALFRFNRDGSGFEVVYSFSPATPDGSGPGAPLSQDQGGTLYGTARQSGTARGGTLFKMSATGTNFSVLRTFASPSEGLEPAGGVVLGSDGALYGTTAGGGTAGLGTLFRYAPAGGAFTVLRHFLATGGDARVPEAPLIEGREGGLLYGATTFGGGAAAGALFRIRLDGSGYEILHRMTNAVSGSNVVARILDGADGRLYAAAVNGGPAGGGTIFSIRRTGGDFKLLNAFAGTGNGLRQPRAGLIQGSDGTLFGTASAGGTVNRGGVFALAPDGTGFRILHEFGATPHDGATPAAGLTPGPDGWIYGSTRAGGDSNLGTLFRLRPDGSAYETFHSFSGLPGDGANPVAALLTGLDGSLYGSTSAGGTHGFGTLIRVSEARNPLLLEIANLGGGSFELSWPATAAGFEIQRSPDPGLPSGWKAAGIEPSVANGRARVTLSPPIRQEFYRLIKKP